MKIAVPPRKKSRRPGKRQTGDSLKPKLLTAIAGIQSPGPIYALHPILREWRDRGPSPP
jgi:hypothetical protein